MSNYVVASTESSNIIMNEIDINEVDRKAFIDRIYNLYEINVLDQLKLDFIDTETTALDLNNLGLHTLPKELSYFTNIHAIDLRNNHLTSQAIIDVFAQYWSHQPQAKPNISIQIACDSEVYSDIASVYLNLMPHFAPLEDKPGRQLVLTKHGFVRVCPGLFIENNNNNNIIDEI